MPLCLQTYFEAEQKRKAFYAHCTIEYQKLQANLVYFTFSASLFPYYNSCDDTLFERLLLFLIQ